MCFAQFGKHLDSSVTRHLGLDRGRRDCCKRTICALGNTHGYFAHHSSQLGRQFLRRTHGVDTHAIQRYIALHTRGNGQNDFVRQVVQVCPTLHRAHNIHSFYAHGHRYDFRMRLRNSKELVSLLFRQLFRVVEPNRFQLVFIPCTPSSCTIHQRPQHTAAARFVDSKRPFALEINGTIHNNVCLPARLEITHQGTRLPKSIDGFAYNSTLARHCCKTILQWRME